MAVNDAERRIVDEIKITVRVGDKVRLRSGAVLRVIDKTLGGELVGVPGRRLHYRYGGTAFRVEDVIEWRVANGG